MTENIVLVGLFCSFVCFLTITVFLTMLDNVKRVIKVLPIQKEKINLQKKKQNYKLFFYFSLINSISISIHI